MRQPDPQCRATPEARLGQLYAELRAIEQERRRVAKELHDDVLPALARLIRSVQTQGDESSDRTALVDSLHEAVAALRDLLGELHPVDLEELGLTPALNNICLRYARLTGLCVVFIERTEDCPLSELQQRCLYRAIQAALRMFSDSENDILIVTHDRLDDYNFVTVKCVDKRVSSADWISVDKSDFDEFEAWCTLAGAAVEIGAPRANGFPYDLIIAVADNAAAALSEEEYTAAKEDLHLFANLAVESERKRIAADINRLILPRLTKVYIAANNLADRGTTCDVIQKLEVIEFNVLRVISNAHPEWLAASGLVPSIEALVERFRRGSAIHTELTADAELADLDLPLEAKFAIYRVTQEALNNIEKHSAASQARVTIKHTDDGLSVHIEDNGKGFQGKKNVQSRGLKNIRERAAQIGARVAWDSSITFESGTLVTIHLCSNSLG